MSKVSHHSFRLAILLSVLVFAGCSHELAKKQTYPTGGQVLVNGEPARYIYIRLEPKDRAVGMPAEGGTGADGRFTLRTYSNEDPDGAVPGEYEVTLADSPGGDATAVPVPKGETRTRIPPELQSPGVTVEVKAEDNDLVINVP
jgi:hypothetical protein